MEIRKAKEEDVSKIRIIEKEAFSDSWSEGNLFSHVSADYGVSYVAECDGEVVGYLLASFLPPESELYRIAVLSTYKRRGIGEALLRYYLDDIHQNHGKIFFLDVRSQNTPAISLYTKMGYTSYNIRKKYYKKPDDDAILMKLED